MGNEFSGIYHESYGVFKNLILSTGAIGVAVAFGNFYDSLIQHIVPYQENKLYTSGQRTLFRFLLVIFLFMILIAFSILLQTKFCRYRKSCNEKKKKKKKHS